MSVIIQAISYEGLSHAMFSEAEALAAGIPQGVIDAAVLAQSRAGMVCTPRQARLALAAAGLLDDVEAFIVTADASSKITWEYATEVRRTDPMVAALSSVLALSDDAVDALFVAACDF